jgi:hypothetical protein
MTTLQATRPAVKPETAREYQAWVSDMRSRRDTITADGRRTEVIGRVYALMFGREFAPNAYGAAGEFARAEKQFTRPETTPPWLRPAFTALMVDATTPAPVAAPPEPAPAGETPYLTDADLARIDALIARMKALSVEHAYRFGGFPPLPTDADDRTDFTAEFARRDASLERQMAESWAMDRYESGAGLYDRCDDDFRGCLAGHDATEGGSR